MRSVCLNCPPARARTLEEKPPNGPARVGAPDTSGSTPSSIPSSSSMLGTTTISRAPNYLFDMLQPRLHARTLVEPDLTPDPQRRLARAVGELRSLRSHGR